MYWMGLRYYLGYYKNWLISVFIFTVLFCVSIFLSYEWTYRIIQIDKPFMSFIVESLNHTAFIYATVVLLGIILVCLVKFLGFFRKKDIELFLEVKTQELKDERDLAVAHVADLMAIFNQAPIGILVTRRGKIIYSNKGMQEFLGASEDELYTRSIDAVFPLQEEFIKIHQKATISLAKKIPLWVGQLNLTDSTQRKKLYQVTAFGLNHERKLSDICWVFQDYSAEERNIEMEKYYQTVFRVLALLHQFDDQDDERKLLFQMLEEIIGIYGLNTGFFLEYRNKQLTCCFLVGDDRFFPSRVETVSVLDPFAKEAAICQAVLSRKACGYNNIADMPYYQKYFQREKRKPVLSTYAFPVIIDNKVEGVISLYAYSVNFFSDNLIFRLQQLISEICTYIEDIRLRQRTQKAIHQYEERLRAQIKELEENKKIMQRQAEDASEMVSDLIAARDAAEAASRSKTDFLANISHELRTPLNAILGFSEAIEAETFGPLNNPHYKEYVNYISSSGKHLLSLINDILDLSCVEAGKHQIKEVEIDLEKCLDENIALVSKYPGGDKRKIVVSCHPSPLILKADERSLNQIILNVLSNAIKFTQEGGHIKIEAGLTELGSLRISFQDDGIGVPKDKIIQLFQPFSQVENVMTRTHKGTGLGLVLIKKLVELHQGRVWMESEQGKGTNIIMEFPKDRVLLVEKEKK